MSGLKGIERLAWSLGVGLLAAFGAIRAYGWVVQQDDLQRFADMREAQQDAGFAGRAAGATAALGARPPADFSLWSEKRVRAYREAVERDCDAPLAVLRIPRLELEVAVLEGTNDLVLDRAVGHIEGTARPGESGNIGIAGHRDGFFRGLKDIQRGDVIELATLEGTESYVVDDRSVVEPEAVTVLRPTSEPSITLVTCYPFYFVGSAPQRFIVRGVRAPLRADARSASSS
jgi:sortase A